MCVGKKDNWYTSKDIHKFKKIYCVIKFKKIQQMIIEHFIFKMFIRAIGQQISYTGP